MTKYSIPTKVYHYVCMQCSNTDQSLISDEYVFNIPKSDKHITLHHVSNGDYTGYTQCEECGSDLIERYPFYSLMDKLTNVCPFAGNLDGEALGQSQRACPEFEYMSDQHEFDWDDRLQQPTEGTNFCCASYGTDEHDKGCFIGFAWIPAS